MANVIDQFANFASSAITGGAGGVGAVLNTSDTVLLLNTGDGAKFPVNGPFRLLIGSPAPTAPHEIVIATSRSVDTLFLTRGQEGFTTSVAWPVGTTVQEGATAATFQNIWNQISQLTFNVKLYGAKGDGVTDDTAAIQAAINAAVAAGGGVVFFPLGTYVLSSALSVTGDNIILKGAGWGSVLQPTTNANTDIIATGIPGTVGASGYIRYYLGVEQLKLDGSKMSGTTLGQGNGIHWYGARYSYIDRVFFYHIPNWAALLEGDNTTPGFNFGYDNVISRCKFDLCAANVMFDGCEGNDLVNCRLDYALATTSASQGAFGARGTYANHVYLNSGYNYVAGNVIGKGGSYTTPAVYATNSGPCRIIGNRFDQVRNQAVVLNAGNHEFAFNAVGSPGSAGTGVPGVQLGSSNNRVVGNSFDVTAGAISATYAIQELGGPFYNNVIADNNCLPGTQGVIKISASSTTKIHDNANYNPVGTLTAPAIPVSGTAYTNTSGVTCQVFIFGGTIQSTLIANTSTGFTTGAFSLPVGQTITINYSAAPTWVWSGF